MGETVQHIVVLLLVAACVGFVAWQGVKTFTFRKGGKLGACCAKGCPTDPAPQPEQQQDGSKRIVFMTRDMIGVTRKRHQ